MKKKANIPDYLLSQKEQIAARKPNSQLENDPWLETRSATQIGKRRDTARLAGSSLMAAVIYLQCCRYQDGLRHQFHRLAQEAGVSRESWLCLVPFQPGHLSCGTKRFGIQNKGINRRKLTVSMVIYYLFTSRQRLTCRLY